MNEIGREQADGSTLFDVVRLSPLLTQESWITLHGQVSSRSNGCFKTNAIA